jgi:PiT family inorganic phosphate transporter
MTLLITIIVLALIFDFINGFHDAANSIATIVSTKGLTPFAAVIWAAFFNFMAYLIFDLNIADTISKTVVTELITLQVIFAGLIAAITWNLFTWWFGIPSSSSHTLIGGLAGAAFAHGGMSAVHFGVIGKIAAFILLAPLIGMFMSYTISVIILWIFRHFNPHKTEKYFRRSQLVTSALLSIGHGGNDAQKVMGLIGAAVLVFINQNPNYTGDYHSLLHGFSNGGRLSVPEWVPLACYTVISLGTLSGGWKIVKTMGSKITKITPVEGIAAESASAITLFLTEFFRIPVSTTHTITGSIIGVGIPKGIGAVKWGVTVNLMWAWILTIPVSAAISAFVYYMTVHFIA